METAATPALFFSHPALSSSPIEGPPNDPAPIIWTADMDDMLRIVIRQRQFDFKLAAEHIRRYIVQVGCFLPCPVPCIRRFHFTSFLRFGNRAGCFQMRCVSQCTQLMCAGSVGRSWTSSSASCLPGAPEPPCALVSGSDATYLHARH